MLIAKKKQVEFYECHACGSTKKPKKTSEIIDMEYMYECTNCHHVGPFDEFLPEDSYKYLWT